MLLAALTALLIWIGRAIGGQSGLIYGLVFAGIMNFGAYWLSDKIVLAMHGAQAVEEKDAPELVSLVRNLATRADLPMPKVYIVPEGPPNAFATGRNPQHGAVAVTENLLKILNYQELEGVLAHELNHIKHRDTLIMAMAATISGALGMLARMAFFMGGARSNEREGGNPLVGLLGIIIAPIAAMLIQLAISRTREYMADESGAKLSGNPLGLANALRKLESWKLRAPLTGGNQALAHLYIVNPFKAGGMASLFMTHPSTAERIRRLEQMAGVAPILAG